jgi:TRAP-type C4-dicarboxylate transport system permease small subunit
MRGFLDTLYRSGLGLSALAFVAIAGLVLLQVMGRVLDRLLTALGLDAVGFAIPSLAEFGGFLFVAAAFLAMPATLRTGGHVRVTLLSAALPGAARATEILVIAGAVGLAAFAAWHSTLKVADSLKVHAVSYGTIPVPLWLPQAAMALGLILFLVALVDELVTALRGGTPSFRAAEAARAVQGEGE